MTRTLRKGVEAKRPPVKLEIVAGHKGRPAVVKKKAAHPEDAA